MKKKLIKTIVTAVCFLTLALGAVATVQVEARSISIKNPVTIIHPMELPPSH